MVIYVVREGYGSFLNSPHYPHKTAPPLTLMISPVIKVESPDARNKTLPAISSAVPALPKGINESIFSLSSPIKDWWLISVSTQPGATQFTLILYGASSAAKDLVRLITAPLEAA